MKPKTTQTDSSGGIIYHSTWFSKISTKLATLITLIIGAISIFIHLYFPTQMQNQAIHDLILRAQSIGAMIAFSVVLALERDTSEEVKIADIEAAFRVARENKDIVFIVLKDSSDKVIAAFNGDRADQVMFQFFYDETTFRKKPITDQWLFTSSTPVINNDGVLGHLYMGISLIDLKGKIKRMRKTVALVSGIIFVVCVLAVFAISTLVTGPLHHIVETVEQISKGDLTKRTTIKSEDEVGQLGRSFNFMIDRLEYTYHELESLSHDLERRVDVRTQELQWEIIERKHTEKELKKAKEAAESANRSKSDFLSKMSHELRTPLNSVIGFANILRKNKKENLSKQELTFISRILTNGKHLLVLINDILDLSRIEAGKMVSEMRPVSIEELVKDTVNLLESQVSEKEVKLLANVPESMGPIETDLIKLKQVIINLVGNSIKFTEKGSVTVSVTADPATNKPIQIDVIDTGIGIPNDQLKRIFEAFQQADNSTARRFGGTGLGLTISKSLCQLMGYDLKVESEVGTGSTFSIILESASTETL